MLDMQLQSMKAYSLGSFAQDPGLHIFTVVCDEYLMGHAWVQVMLDMQLQSMRAYNPAGFGQDPGLHFITQRYALLTTSLLLLNADYQVQLHFTSSLGAILIAGVLLHGPALLPALHFLPLQESVSLACNI